ncbi:hypothetical protein Ahy_A07g037010 [Arachis hypogaea]|uniref:AMP-dependent synthetase/ligase domain-containing protein n=1 Tax=Arachis hypogaea TaxID=3818 RepID=A0A445CHJ8_ARAHY|nr:hypothetical protein Ahy_A07g037010 [Arachis hypogaea]
MLFTRDIRDTLSFFIRTCWQVQVANLQRSVRNDTESWKLYPQLWLRARKNHLLQYAISQYDANFQGVKCGIYGANCPGWIISMEHSYVCVCLGAGAVEFIICHAEILIAFVEKKKIPKVLLLKLFVTSHLWLVLRYAILNLELIQAAISLAKQEGLLVSLDLASFEMVRKFKLPLMKLLESGNIDLCFSNQDEATELQKWGDCHLDLDLDCTLQHIGVFFHSFDTLHPFRDEYNADPVAAVEFLAKYCKRNVVTLGHNGCIAKHGKEVLDSTVNCLLLCIDHLENMMNYTVMVVWFTMQEFVLKPLPPNIVHIRI